MHKPHSCTGKFFCMLSDPCFLSLLAQLHNLIQATLPLFWSPLFWLCRFMMLCFTVATVSVISTAMIKLLGSTDHEIDSCLSNPFPPPFFLKNSLTRMRPCMYHLLVTSNFIMHTVLQTPTCIHTHTHTHICIFTVEDSTSKACCKLQGSLRRGNVLVQGTFWKRKRKRAFASFSYHRLGLSGLKLSITFHQVSVPLLTPCSGPC